MKIQKISLLIASLFVGASAIASAAQSPAYVNRHTRVASDLAPQMEAKATMTESVSYSEIPAYVNRHTRVASDRAMNKSEMNTVASEAQNYEQSPAYINRHTRVASDRSVGPNLTAAAR